jgi:xanthine dehydrogenase YagS FAD-binding subunit
VRAFTYAAPTDLSSALARLAEPGTHAVMGGGTDLVNSMKTYIETPEDVVDLQGIRELRTLQTSGDPVQIGAAVKVVDLLASKPLQQLYPILMDAGSVVATPQIRNIGTVGGNLCQRPRCWYFRSEDFNCLRKGGTECYAILGENRYHAILGGLGCFIVSPSDLGPALIALDAQAVIGSASGGTRSIPLESFFIGPDVDVHRETVLLPGEMLVRVDVPRPAGGQRGVYLKARGRETWDFATTAAAVSLVMTGSTCTSARVVLGGVAPKPWRSTDAEAALQGKTITAAVAAQAAAAAVKLARPMQYNAYKVDQVQVLIQRAVLQAAGVGG